MLIPVFFDQASMDLFINLLVEFTIAFAVSIALRQINRKRRPFGTWLGLLPMLYMGILTYVMMQNWLFTDILPGLQGKLDPFLLFVITYLIVPTTSIAFPIEYIGSYRHEQWTLKGPAQNQEQPI